MNILQRYSTPKSSDKIFKLTVTVIWIALPVLLALYLSVGSADASLFRAVGALFRGDHSSPDFKIVFLLRFPRALGALVAGAALSVSGIIIQAVLNNPMAAPNIIGVNAGAGLAAVICMALAPALVAILPLASFVGALLTTLLIYAVSRAVGAGRVTVTLVGIAVGSILSALINAAKIFFPDAVYDIVGFQIGSLSSVGYRKVLPAAAVVILATVLSVILSRSLDVISLGDEVAMGLGINLTRVKLLLLIIASALAGAAVSFAGLIGFVGLIAPHIFRRLVGGIHLRLIPVGILGGALLVLLSDLIAKTVASPYELPVGIILSLAGGPFFIYLIIRAGGKRVK